MLLPGDAKLIVKHTFLELVLEPEAGKTARRWTVPSSSPCDKDYEEIMSNSSTRASVPSDLSEDERTPRQQNVVASTGCIENEDVASSPEKTTVMLRNVPYNCSRDSVIRMMDEAGFHGLYNFIYLPIDFRSKSGFGYAFINMVSNAAAEQLFTQFNGFSGWAVKSQKVAEVTWSEPSQGLNIHVERYRNSPVMHDAVPDEFKPAMYENGVRIVFPPPTKAIRPPRFRRR